MFVLDELVQSRFPKLHAHLHKHEIDFILFATNWFITLYTGVLPFKLVVRLIDTFLCEKMKILYRVALTILKYKEKELLEANSLDKIMLGLKNFKDPKWFDDDKFIKTAFEIKLKTIEILQIEKRYVPEKPRSKTQQISTTKSATITISKEETNKTPEQNVNKSE